VASSRRDQQGDRLEDAVRREPAGSQDLVIDRLRPASVRTIDEDDPFR
jgi:hypothetical protein